MYAFLPVTSVTSGVCLLLFSIVQLVSVFAKTHRRLYLPLCHRIYIAGCSSSSKMTSRYSTRLKGRTDSPGTLPQSLFRSYKQVRIFVLYFFKFFLLLCTKY